ncbi:Na+/H+ antiporter NhaA [Devosia psychrophila]|uniref:Na(+)/H(+) antiporter NhaA n=1 Tax=Devosia psychrophila TaxID=728005 RepID=A0A0F5PVC6_9HYPH|nr:Na+/H+ antiporter NhaA [Devosia psychrophila]KKC32642.1 pH-dependent sodium/proton antiporter [Devosia psychrophila]SFC50881.1 sodium/proton antiporter, NhaA family (TC 2.A.33.1.1) [Devosia psychrophila]
MSSSHSTQGRPTSVIRAFLDNASSGGIVLMFSAALALVVANSPLGTIYADTLHAYVGGLSVLHWINDGLMAVFFLMVGLEIKREVVDGQLSTWSRRILPGSAALGGMIGPALVFLAFNMGDGGHPNGWAIPAATDIAFALGVLSLLGSRVPMSLKVFLTALAIIDDLGAVVIIALFYTSSINAMALAGAAAVIVALVAMNRFGVRNLVPYLVLGAILWFLVLQSGVHATLAGVILALTIPLKKSPTQPDNMASPLHKLEHAIQPWVTFLIIPIFGFANAGVSFAGMSIGQLTDPVPLGIAAGLFIGKQVGVFAASVLVIRAGWAELPMYASWRQLYGVALLCGIGFTMSLFIGLLAFPESVTLQHEVKIGVLLGSILSAAVGALLLRSSRPRTDDIARPA